MAQKDPSHVVSFRLTSVRWSLLTEVWTRLQPVRVRSAKQMARKIVEDYLDGKLVYKNEADAVKVQLLGKTEA